MTTVGPGVPVRARRPLVARRGRPRRHRAGRSAWARASPEMSGRAAGRVHLRLSRARRQGIGPALRRPERPRVGSGRTKGSRIQAGPALRLRRFLRESGLDLNSYSSSIELAAWRRVAGRLAVLRVNVPADALRRDNDHVKVGSPLLLDFVPLIRILTRPWFAPRYSRTARSLHCT